MAKRVAVCLGLIVGMVGGPAVALAQCPMGWAHGFEAPGLDEPVHALAVFDGGYRVYIVNEIHNCTPRAVQAWLTTLEHRPPKVLFLFTTTIDADSLFGDYCGPFGSRCKVVNFTNQGLAQAFAIRAGNRPRGGPGRQADHGLRPLGPALPQQLPGRAASDRRPRDAGGVKRT